MKRFAVLAAALVALAVPSSALASHAWGYYHWARTANPFTLKLGDNVSGAWDPYLATTSSDWKSTVLDTAIVSGQGGKSCKATTGRAEVCSRSYGYNGWLGLAQIWASGSHITKGTVKVNDSYFSLAQYNNAYEKQHVMCQEVGHIFGLDHTSEDGSSQKTCMDYSSDPLSTHPNQHDYDQLASIYAHLDSTTTVASGSDSGPGKGNGKPQKIRDNLFVEDLGNGVRRFTFVYWVAPGLPHEFPQVD